MDEATSPREMLLVGTRSLVLYPKIELRQNTSRLFISNCCNLSAIDGWTALAARSLLHCRIAVVDYQVRPELGTLKSRYVKIQVLPQSLQYRDC